jgi:hypothetical protein
MLGKLTSNLHIAQVLKNQRKQLTKHPKNSLAYMATELLTTECYTVLQVGLEYCLLLDSLCLAEPKAY